MSLVKSALEAGNARAPKSAIRAFILGSTSARALVHLSYSYAPIVLMTVLVSHASRRQRPKAASVTTDLSKPSAGG
jgi:hypothetical protein